MLRLMLCFLSLLSGWLHADCRPAAVGGWNFASDSYACDLALTPLIDIKDNSLQPEGSLLASSVVNLATLNKISPEQVLYICELSDAAYLQQAYAINSANQYAKVQLSQYPGYYSTWFDDVAVRLTNMVTGEFFAGWKTSSISGEPFVDSDGISRLAIKAKHFDNVKIELIKIDRRTQHTQPQVTYRDPQPIGYITLKGPGLAANDIVVGTHSRPGWPLEWVGAYSLYNNLTLRYIQSCTITNVTPMVVFPPVSLNTLLEGGQLRANIKIEINCSHGAGQAVMGIQVSENSFKQAQKITGLTTPDGGVYYLLSDGYGEQQGVAKGVGIRFERNSDGQRLILIGQNSLPTQANILQGYYPVVQGIKSVDSTDSGREIYTYDFSAILERLLLAEKITPGRINARAYIVVRVL